MSSLAKPPRRAPIPPPPKASATRRQRLRSRLRWQVTIAAVAVTVAAAAFATALFGERAFDGLSSLSSRAEPAPSYQATDDPAALYLVRSTLMSLDDANQTGNYAVLRLLGSKSFQVANSPEDLARIFSAQRAAGLDFSVAALQAPRLSSAPMVGADRLLRLSGSYEQATGLLQFSLAFAPEGGVWRLEAIHVALAPSPDRLAATVTGQELTGR